jgi:ketosteroid isomerase-like protein
MALDGPADPTGLLPWVSGRGGAGLYGRAMAAGVDRSSASSPDDLERLYVERVNAGDVEGLLALFEPDAVLAFGPGRIATGSAEIRRVFEEYVASGVRLRPGGQRPTLRAGDLAFTSTRLDDGGVTAEIARRQPDGTWRWVIDRWDVAVD